MKIKETFKRIFGGYDFDDLFVLTGTGLFVWGTWQIYRPAAFILAGAFLVWWGMRGSRIKAARRKNHG
jgi:hypothetical protein